MGTQEARETALPWGQLLLVLATPLSVMVAMLNFAPLLPMVQAEFGLSSGWAGALASATLLSHTLFQLPAGYLADRIGVRRAVDLGLLLMAGAVVASGLATAFPALLLFRFLLGFGTATVFIAGLTCVNSLVSPERRVVAQGLFGAAANAGVLLVLLLSEWASRWDGWRGVFLIEGALILGVAAVITARLRPEGGGVQPVHAAWGETLRQRPLYLLGLAHVLGYGVFTALATWMATFLWRQNGIGLEWAGPLAALLPGSAIVARTLGGALSVGRERRAIILCCLVTSVGVALLPLLSHPVVALLDLLVVGWFASMPFGAVFSYISVFAPKGAIGSSSSLVNFVGNIGALAFPSAVGYALDASGSFSVGFGLLAAVGLAGTGVLALWLPGSGPAAGGLVPSGLEAGEGKLG